ncbi:MAG: prolyl oligopeptidase family serine peptidase, partial [Planctomycetota bacterium]
MFLSPQRRPTAWAFCLSSAAAGIPVGARPKRALAGSSRCWTKASPSLPSVTAAVRNMRSPRSSKTYGVRRSVRFIRSRAKKFGVDPDRLGVTGASAGGHLSLMLGTASDKGNPDSDDEILRTSNRVAAVVAYFPPTDIRPWVNKVPDFPALNFEEEKAAACSPIVHVSKDDPPTLLIHGDK